MKFTTEQIEIIEAARPAWEGLQHAGTINLGTMAMSNLKDLYNSTFGKDGKNPEWSHGCIDCVMKCMAKFYKDPNGLEAASIAGDEQPEAKPTKPGKKSSTKK